LAAFLDTNIIRYAFATASDGDTQKVSVAKDRIDRLTLNAHAIADVVAQLVQQVVIPIDASLVLLALERVQQSRISYWDGLILEAAIRSGATILDTEDMHHGTRYGALELRNPFVG
jgi:predicted nucleic acid-binding protein